jgi:hypothetical protein
VYNAANRSSFRHAGFNATLLDDIPAEAALGALTSHSHMKGDLDVADDRSEI